MLDGAPARGIASQTRVHARMQAAAAASASYGGQPPMVEFVSAPLSYFALELLEAKGRRKNVDVGDPHDFTRPLVKGLEGGGSVGSWACTEGGWDSPTPRTSTEFFYVLSGNGCVRALVSPSPVAPQPSITLCFSLSLTLSRTALRLTHTHSLSHSAPSRSRVPPPAAPDPSPVSSPTGGARPVTVEVSPAAVHAARPGLLRLRQTAVTPLALEAALRRCVSDPDGTRYPFGPGDVVVLPKGWYGRWDISQKIHKVCSLVSPCPTAHPHPTCCRGALACDLLLAASMARVDALVLQAQQIRPDP
jgi:uncharacterized cupin superfamily protein